MAETGVAQKQTKEISLYLNQLHYEASMQLAKSNPPTLVLESGAHEVKLPDIALLLAFNLIPAHLSNIAVKKIPIKKDGDKPSVVEEKKDDGLIELTEDERVERVLSILAPTINYKLLEGFDQYKVKMFACGRLEIPNIYYFTGFVEEGLEALVMWYRSPPSTWGMFQQYKDKIAMFDLDRAAMIYLRHHMIEEKKQTIDLITKGMDLVLEKMIVGRSGL